MNWLSLKKLWATKTFLSMRLTIYVLLLAVIQGYATNSYSQVTKLNLDLKDTSVKEVLSKIEQDSEFYFLYNSKIVDVNRKVTINIKNKKIDDVLDILFENQNVEYTIVDRQIVLSAKDLKDSNSDGDQQNVIQGKVTDDKGEPLPGVTIILKGTAQGTITDVNGNYTLPNVTSEQTVMFSFVGMTTQEILVGNQTTINVSMRVDAFGIEEVVAIGYTTKKVSELSSAVSVVQEEDLQGVTTSNLGTMLQGKVSGVRVSNTTGRPGQNPQIVIRGVGSLGAGYNPLFVVDGIIGGTYNPEDIETITVLKDAAASGLYGSRAANGVVVITTKSGKKGETVVRFNSSYGTTSHVDGNLDPMSAQELFDYHRTGATNSYYLLDNPSQTLEEYLESKVPTSNLDYQTDWQSLLKRTGSLNKHQVSVSGGSDKTTFYLGGNYFKEKGTMINMEYQQMDIRANINHEISKVFDLGFRIAVGQSENPNEPQGGQEGLYSRYLIAMPFDRPFDDDGNPINPYDPNVNWFGNAKSNYFYSREHYEDETKRLNLSTDVTLAAKITDWVTFTTSNRVGFNGTDRTQVFDKFHFLANSENGISNSNFGYTSSIITSNKFNFKKLIGEHSLNGILGQEYSYSKYKYVFGEGMDLPFGLSAINATGSPRDVGGNTTEVGFKSYFAQFDYSYRSKYYLVASYRYDASSRFGANNRWGNFYAIGTSWVLSRENFLADVDWLDMLKLKVSYGTTGNANITDYLSLSSYSFAGSYSGNSAATPARLANPDLTWEVAHTTNIGIELATFERIKLELDWYNRVNKDLLQSVPLSAATGFANQQKNIGEVQNRGIDLNLTTTNIDGEFQWTTNFNINFNKSEILSLNNNEDIASGNMRFSVGKPLRNWYMREWAGVDSENGKPLWVKWEDENGNKIDQVGGDNPTVPANITTTSDRRQASLLFGDSPYPDFYGGLRNDFYYKGFTLSILTDFSHGNTIYSSIRVQMDSDGAYMWHNKMNLMDDWKRWEQPGDEATHPQLLYNGNNQSYFASSRYIEDASYFRIQNISLSYSLRKPVAFFSNIHFNVNFDNVATFTKFSGQDPSMNMENPNSGQGANGGGFAPTRKVIFGIGFDL